MGRKSGAGGRPKNDEAWKHVTKKEGNRVSCNYCNLEFAASSATRINAHIKHKKDKGISFCKEYPKPHKTDGSNQVTGGEEQDLLHPQGLQQVDRARDYNKLNERILDCYMSPKTMWEGIKALQQDEAMHQERIKVGPFYVSNDIVNERDLQLIQHIFEHSGKLDILFSSSRSHLCQLHLTTLRPKTNLDSSVIDIFADILTDIERRKTSKPVNWYLPVMFSTAALGDLNSFLDFVERQKMRENYMSHDLEYCEKIFIPIYVGSNSCGHYYLYVIHVKNRQVEIWDSLSHAFMDKTERDQKTEKLLCAMENIFKKDIMFTKFVSRMATNIPLQSNGYDCGIFVINYMQQLHNYVEKKPSLQFDSDEERLKLALKLLKSDLNQEKGILYDKATKSHNTQVDNEKDLDDSKNGVSRTHVGLKAVASDEEDLDLHGIKRKRDDTTFEDVGRKTYLDSDDRVKRNNVDMKSECAKGSMLRTIDLVGYQFQRNAKTILKWIMEDMASTIGIWGMAGIGKTALATHVRDKLLKEISDAYDHIIWLTMSQYDKSIYKLQKDIASSINLDISNEDDIKRRSEKLLHASKQINRCILILDDVRDPISLEEVGFHVSNSGIQLILTTRSWKVCQSMNCMSNIINVKPLDGEDSQDLFERALGIHEIQSSWVKNIGKEAVKQCDGLPLAIITMTRSMISLQNNMDEELKSSYDRLKDDKLQRFFLYFALSAPSKGVSDVDVEGFTRRFWYEEEGWADETKSLVMLSYEGYSMLDLYMLDQLKNNSLLIHESGYWRMRPLLRAMAINIAKKDDEIMTKSGMSLEELSDCEKWKENLHKVFLTDSKIQKILNNISPKCPKLSTLLLDHNYGLKRIPKDFFNNMPALGILDLSKTNIKRLPKSLSNLKSLIALLLSECRELSHVPSLAKMKRLTELDLSGTAITKAPHGLELLVNLRYLNLEDTRYLKMSSSPISKMTNLQSLRLMNWFPNSVDVRGQDLQDLRRLEVIDVNFREIEEFNAVVKSLLEEDREVRSYYLCLCLAMLDYGFDLYGAPREAYLVKRVGVRGIDLANRVVVLPKDMNHLIIEECELEDLNQIVAPPFTSFLNLRYLRIEGCKGMKNVMRAGLLGLLPNLESIEVRDCEWIEEIVVGGENDESDTPITLPKLTYVVLSNLRELRDVYKGTMLCPSLQSFHAFHCEKLKPPHINIGKERDMLQKKDWTGFYFSWKRDNQEEGQD